MPEDSVIADRGGRARGSDTAEWHLLGVQQRLLFSHGDSGLIQEDRAHSLECPWRIDGDDVAFLSTNARARGEMPSYC